MIGAHVGRVFIPRRSGITEHIKIARDQAAECGVALNVVQIFAMGPKDRKIHMSPAEIEVLKTYAAATDLHVLLHNAYTAPAWTVHGKDLPIYGKYIQDQLRIMSQIDNSPKNGLVVHLDTELSDRVVKILPNLYIPDSIAKIYLEIPAVREDRAHYSHIDGDDGLYELFRKTRESIDPTLSQTGLCIDTAHLHADGIAIRTHDEADAWLSQLMDISDILPPSNIIIHLNDSTKPMGMVPDEHTHLCQGAIWGFSREMPTGCGLHSFVQYGVDNNIPLILERGGGVSLDADYGVLYPMIPYSWRTF